MIAATPASQERSDAPRPQALLGRPGPTNAFKLVAVCFAVYWVCLLPLWPAPRGADDTAMRLLTISAAALMWWVAASSLRGLLHAGHVLARRQTPLALWREVLWAALRRVAGAWLMLSGAMATALLLTGATMQACAAAALISLTALLAGACAANRQSRWAGITGWLYGAAGIWFATDASAFRALANAGFVLPGLITPAFPAALLLTARRWNHAAPLVRWRPSAVAPVSTRWQRVQLQLRRFSLLRWRRAQEAGSELQASGGVMLFITSFALLYPAFMAVYLVLPVWRNGHVDLWRLVVTLWIASLTSNTLVARDVGWRSFLMPGGLHRGRIGSHIWTWTLVAQLLGALAYALLALAVVAALPALMGHPGDPAAGFAKAMREIATAPLDLMLITSAAVTLRAMPHGGKLAAAAGVAVVCVLAWAALHWERALALATTQLALPLPLYCAVLIVASAVLVILANRWWTPKRLFQLHSD